MVRIVVHILYQHVLVQTEVRPQEVVSPESHQLVPVPYALCASVFRPSLAHKEEVGSRALQASGCYFCGNLLRSRGPL